MAVRLLMKSTAFALIFVTQVWAQNATTGSGNTEIISHYDFAGTISKISESLQKNNMKIFARIDHQAAARSVGLDMPPTMVIVYGNPAAGTKFMLENPQLALDLPLRVLISETRDGNAVQVSWHPAESVIKPYGMSENAAMALSRAEKIISDAISHQ
ncbi:DUF302 domain-containing protein [Laribacter hongkongensis]|nr:DUF302 domain-containing protein [Laribacter hongkongensis]MCG9105112.1 DUF302 domain-containing protein [Laribacter hongkongensis]MCG9114236.1 DUF302 domain-containing protein [Laribacter hongkongensis]